MFRFGWSGSANWSILGCRSEDEELAASNSMIGVKGQDGVTIPMEKMLSWAHYEEGTSKDIDSNYKTVKNTHLLS